MTISMRSSLLLLSAFLLAFPLHAQEADNDGPTNDERDAVVGIDPDALKKDGTEATKPVIKSKLNEEDREKLKRLEEYFNGIRTMKADFTQTLADGRAAKGKIYLSRPGRMRLEYAPPSKDMLVADGTFVHVWDSQAKTSSSVPIGTSLADVILRDNFSFSGDITVTEMRYYPSMMEVSLVQTGSPASGTLTLEFQDNPLKLRNWRVVDAQGQQTRVSLSNDEVNANIPSSTFYYRDPNFGKPKK
jgi:outer membrane lipoprotein-sorting protein